MPSRRRPDADLKQTFCGSELSDIAIGQLSLEERKAAYLAARERIFTGYDGETNRFTEQKPRGDPVVARRMISHALGRKFDLPNQTISQGSSGQNDVQSDEMNTPQKDLDAANSGQCYRPDVRNKKIIPTSVKEKLNKPEVSRPRRSNTTLDKESLKQEQKGAAKRMFAHALGFPSGKDGIPKNGLK